MWGTMSARCGKPTVCVMSVGLQVYNAIMNWSRQVDSDTSPGSARAAGGMFGKRLLTLASIRQRVTSAAIH